MSDDGNMLPPSRVNSTGDFGSNNSTIYDAHRAIQSEHVNNSQLENGQATPQSATRTHHRESALSSLGCAANFSPTLFSQNQVRIDPKSTVPSGQPLDQHSSGPQPRLFTYPPTYGSFQNPLQPPDERYENRETDNSGSYSQRPVPIPPGVLLPPNVPATLCGCSSGDTCQSIGCKYHPYKDATKEYVRSAYVSSGFSGTSVERDNTSQLISVSPLFI